METGRRGGDVRRRCRGRSPPPGRRRLSVVALAALFLPVTVAGQERGFLVRGHLGGGHVEALLSRDDLDRTEVGLVGGIGVSWSLSDRFRLGLDLEQHRLFEGSPDVGEPFEGLGGVLGTTALLAAVQYRFGDAYVRPGVGLSYHSFGRGRASNGEIVFEDVSGEPGLAGGVALGLDIARSGPFTFLVEGLARWTGGEDSTSSRRLLALTLGAALRP